MSLVRSALAALLVISAPRPSPAAEAILSPHDASVVPGATLRFHVTLDGKAPAVDVAWRVVPPHLGAITEDGLFTAGATPGRGIVRAEIRREGGSVVAHALVTVGRWRAPRRIRVLPESASLRPGEEVVFRAVPPEGEGGDALVSWSVAPEAAGTIDAAGRFRAGEWAGAARVLASVLLDGDAVEGAARVWIGDRPSEAPEIEVHPSTAELRPGDVVRYEARVRPPAPDSVLAAIRWSLFPETLGRIAGDGTLTAGESPGEGRVVATLPWDGRATHGFARARVLPRPGAAALQIEPPAALLAPGRSIGFEARVLGPSDARPADLRWSVSPAGLGTIGPDGVFRAFEADAYPEASLHGDVIARATVAGATLEASARVRISPPATAELELRPRFITTSPGGEVPVRALLDGRALPTEVPLQWSLLPPTLGTVTADGLFTANRVLATAAADDFGRREGVLVATALLPEGKVARGTARVVVVPSFVRPQIAVFPALATVGLDGQVAFRIAPAGGGEVDAPSAPHPPVTWLVRPDRLGTIGPDGVFFPNVRFGLVAALEGLEEVEGRVIAEVRVSPGETLIGEARLVLRLPDPALLDLVIDPHEVSLTAVASQRFVGRLGGRDIRDLPMQAVWSLSPPGLGTITPDGFFTPLNEYLPNGSARSGFVRLTVTSRTGTSREATSPIVITY